MNDMIIVVVASLSGAVVGGGITFLLNRQLHQQQLALLREQHKTEYMAEETVRLFLKHSGYVDRSFETLQKQIGGFTDDELRRILVRAGAIRNYRSDGSEWWRLTERVDEFIKRKRDQRRMKQED